MLRRLGYVAIALSIAASTNRTCRLGNATPQRLRGLIAANLAGLAEVLAFNARNDVGLYRISSQIIPFASHAAMTFPWWEEFGEELRHIGDFVKRQDMRVSMHPGQFTVLSSPDPATLEASLRDIEWHVRFLDSLGVDSRHKVIVHLGGIYGDKAAALRRFTQTVVRLPLGWRRRLAIENDERLYAVEDALQVAGESGLPVVFDWLHHHLNPGTSRGASEAMAHSFATWEAERDGVPKVHFSSQQKGGRLGAHADWIDPDEFRRFLQAAPQSDFDCMLEAKKKDLALFRLRHDMATRGWAIGEVA